MESIPASVADAVDSQLAGLGIHLRGDLTRLTSSRPLPMAIEIGSRMVDVAALYMPEMSATAALRLAHSVPTDVPLLVVGPRIHTSSADTMRTRGIWFVDGTGNAYLRDDALLIDVRGRRPFASSPVSEQRKLSPANPFTPKRAQVVFALLTDPALADAPYRDIAERSGVSLGMSKGTMDALEMIGFVENLGSRRRLVRGGELLDLWAAAYPAGLGRSNKLAVVSGDVHSWSAPGDIPIAVSGEYALSGFIRNPESLVLYVGSNGEKHRLRNLMVMNRWHSEPHGNITIRELFWHDLQSSEKIRPAPIALIYADLLASNESRQIEIAHEMRRYDDRLVELRSTAT